MDPTQQNQQVMQMIQQLSGQQGGGQIPVSDIGMMNAQQPGMAMQAPNQFTSANDYNASLGADPRTAAMMGQGVMQAGSLGSDPLNNGISPDTLMNLMNGPPGQ